MHYFTPLQSQQFSKCSSKNVADLFSANFAKIWDFPDVLLKFAVFQTDVDDICSDLREIPYQVVIFR